MWGGVELENARKMVQNDVEVIVQASIAVKACCIGSTNCRQRCARRDGSTLAVSGGAAVSEPTSIPVQKDRPWAARTTARTEPSAPSSSNTALQSGQNLTRSGEEGEGGG